MSRVIGAAEGDISRALGEYAAAKTEQNHAQIERCARLLTTEELWQRENAHCNAVGNLVLHLAGNVRQWVLGGIAGQAITRDRAGEFAERRLLPAGELLAALAAVVSPACAILRSLRAESLTKDYLIQGYAVRGVEAVMHVTEHFSFHTGQIVHVTKALRGVDLSLYDVRGQKLPGENAAP
ncbi:MAG: DUF1572 family protein [Phycisphaerales bacterium]|nr:DUF1572 family protein [Phycisphaerales bacterium]